MIRLIASLLYFLVGLVVSGIVFMPLAVILRYFTPCSFTESYLHAVSSIWGRGAVILAGGRVRVRGRENLPASRKVCFVSNHQDYSDIVLYLGWIGRNVGFVGKKELGAVPILSTWMRLLHSVFIDRGSLREGMRAIKRSAAKVRNGHAMVIFPEGTRSKGGPVAEFKAGSFKMAKLSGGWIVPVSIDGSWRFMHYKGKVRGGPVRMVIHPAIDTSILDAEGWKALPDRMRDIIASAVAMTPESEAARLSPPPRAGRP